MNGYISNFINKDNVKGTDDIGRCMEQCHPRLGGTRALQIQGLMPQIEGRAPKPTDFERLCMMQGQSRRGCTCLRHIQIGKKQQSKNQSGESCCNSSKTVAMTWIASVCSKCCRGEQARTKGETVNCASKVVEGRMMDSKTKQEGGRKQ